MQFSEIKISEIFPNPDGTDTGNEWIELMNTGETAINLANWSIENEKNSQTLSGEIAPQSTKTIQNLKFSLRNSDETIYLKSPDSQIIHQLSYDKAPSGQSYSRITIQKGKDQKSSYDWVSPSKNWPNPIFWSAMYGTSP